MSTQVILGGWLWADTTRDPQYGWGELAREVRVRMIPGSHENIFLEPDLSSLANELQKCLADAQAQAEPTKKI